MNGIEMKAISALQQSYEFEFPKHLEQSLFDTSIHIYTPHLIFCAICETFKFTLICLPEIYLPSKTNIDSDFRATSLR